MYVSPISSNTIYNKSQTGNGTMSFQGLTKKFKHQIYIDGQKDIEKILKEHPNTNPVVGQLPNFIFEKLPKDKRAEAIREILKVFDEVAISIREFDVAKAATIDEIQNRRPKFVNEILTNVFTKYNILSKWDDGINVTYIDQGGKGKVYKIEGLRDYKNEDEFVIKVFHQLKGDN